MRLPSGLIFVFCTGVSFDALAAEPTPPSPPAPQIAPAAGGEQSAATPAAEKDAVPSSTVGSTHAATAVVPSAGKTELTLKDQEMISRGYKLEMRHGEKYFCRRETELGSHFELKSCNTAESIQAHQASSVETVRRMQANKPEISN